ncbi:MULTISPECIES: MmyB family transcriptional regulator [unclassified Bradyrhizobium]
MNNRYGRYTIIGAVTTFGGTAERRLFRNAGWRGCGGAVPEFVKWWEAHEIRSTASGRKTMSHPTKGVLHFEHTRFQANDDPVLKLVIYLPVSGGDSRGLGTSV